MVASDNESVHIEKDPIPFLSQFFYSLLTKTLAVHSFPGWNFSIMRKYP